jgi:hypothetical protein
VDYESVKLGVKSLECASCQGKASIAFNPGEVTFVLKDGESGGWQSKAIKENKYRGRRREIMAKREQDHVFKTRLIPNYKGEETGTWKDAREEARKETGAVGASTYNALVQGEKT